MKLAAICRWISAFWCARDPENQPVIQVQPRYGSSSVLTNVLHPEIEAAAALAASEAAAFELTLPPVFLWVEFPPIARTSLQELKRYYQSIQYFVNKNWIEARVTQLIIRLCTPDTMVEGHRIFANPSQSYLYKYLLQHLPAGMQLRFYPYLGNAKGENNYQALWADHMGEPPEQYITAVYKYVRWWNSELAKVNCPVKFEGVVADIEEKVTLNPDELVQIKKDYPDIPYFEVTIGFDDVRWVYKYHAHVDQYYLQMYDFYAPYVKDMCRTREYSPFLVHRDQPEAMYEWIREQVIQRLEDVRDLFSSRHVGKLYLMWSTQNADSWSCMYPVVNNRCGHSFDFGTWTGKAFSRFLAIVSGKDSVFAKFAGHGIYEFLFIPQSWFLTRV